PDTTPLSQPIVIANAANIPAEVTDGEPATTAAPAMTVEEFLQESVAAADMESAMLTLAELWGIAYDPAAGTACAQAEAQGLSCLFQRGTLNTVRQLDRPAVLTLTGSDGISYRPVLISADDSRGTLRAGEYSETFPLEEISDLWFGQFMLLWRPPNGDAAPIARGMRSENVLWLRQSLAALDSEYRGAVPDSNLFDAELEQQLKAFQQRHRLQVDGLAGQQTLIYINSLLALEGTPRLSSGQ
ncbi:MAG: peptidoglycan-binding protein, partial [Gammaproteobacteria bacterium]|nr:peptidoglycan-binding protein [Gammaproteobacteria bacterium]